MHSTAFNTTRRDPTALRKCLLNWLGELTSATAASRPWRVGGEDMTRHGGKAGKG